MKILHIIASSHLEGGGPIEGVLRLCGVLGKWEHEQDLLTLDAPAVTPLAEANGTIYAMGSPPPAGPGLITRARRWANYSPQALAWAKKNVRNYDIVVVNGLWNYSTHVARRALVGAGVPYIVYSHGMLDPWFRKTYPLKHAAKQLLWLGNEGVLVRHADALAFTCELERELARGTFTPWHARERVVAFGTASPPPHAPAHDAAFRQAIPALRTRPYLLFISRIHEKKGCDLLVEAFRRVAGEHRGIDLVIAGPDQTGLVKGLRARAVALGIDDRVHFPGMLTGDAKWGAFYGCDAFILPSHQENFGIVVAEAIACGRPALISDQINIWMEIDAARAGYVEKDSIDGTEALMRRFFATDAPAQAAMGARGKALFAEKFNITGAARGFLDLAESLVRKRTYSAN